MNAAAKLTGLRANGASQHPGPEYALEQNVLGSLLRGASWTELASIVDEADFDPRHQLIYRAIATLAGEGSPPDVVTVSAQLERVGHLQAAGGLAYLSELARETLSPENAANYAREIRRRADCCHLRSIEDDTELLAEAGRIVERLKAFRREAESVIELRHVADVVDERREAEWLGGLHKILERYVQAVLAGARNTLKSFIASHWAMLAALNGESILILSAEGAGLGRRIEAWMRVHAPNVDLRTLRLLTLERPINLNAPAVLEDLRAAIDASHFTPSLIVIDTFSKYAPGLDENDNAEVAAFLAALGRGLREHYGATVLLVAHAGHGDSKRPRGASVLMANPDAEYIVERPDPTAMSATVTRERFKDSAALPPLAYTAEVVDLGRVDRYGEAVTSLVIKDGDPAAAAVARRPELHGRAQRQLLAALRAQASDGAGMWTMADMREVGRKAGLHKNTARAAAEAIATSPFMKPSVGGWSLADA